MKLEDRIDSMLYHLGEQLSIETTSDVAYHFFDYTYRRPRLSIEYIKFYKSFLERLLVTYKKGYTPLINECHIENTLFKLESLLGINCCFGSRKDLQKVVVDTQWVINNPNCVVKEKWQKCYKETLEDLGFDLEISPVTDAQCELAFNLYKKGIPCDLEVNVSIDQVDCELEVKNLKAEFKDCTLTTNIYKELIDCGLNPEVIKKTYECGLSLKFKDKEPYICLDEEIEVPLGFLPPPSSPDPGDPIGFN